MLWLKAFHIVFVVTWFAGLFYLPRLFVYHAQDPDPATAETFKVMERRLLVILRIGGILAVGFGLAMILKVPAFLQMGWMQLKLVLVATLIAYDIWCGVLVGQFARDQNRHSERWYRWFNEFPSVILIAVVLLAILKPF